MFSSESGHGFEHATDSARAGRGYHVSSRAQEKR